MSAEEKMSAVAESAWAKFAARVVTPILLLIMSAIGTQVASTINAVDKKQEEQGKELGTVTVALATLNTKVDWALVQRISQLEERVRTLERKVNP